MNLSPKAMRSMVEALEFRIAAYQSQLDEAELSEDEVSDVTNDMMFLESLRQELQKALDVPMAQVF
ncbi:hypothetical protein GS601_21110 [Myxacorys almedinensis A]|uniref:Uncharacterized protein n=2 Tax=Myxacorys TaxID=2056239 RepID=A0A8J7Z7V9_9CYAN|nr:hypothetical protein [Myxacorys almedinensis A]